MNYDHLYFGKLLPTYYRSIAIVMGVFAISIGLYFKLSGSEELFDVAPRHLKFILLVSLVIMLFSKNKVEDERTSVIRLQIFKLGFRLLISLIVLMEVNVALSDSLDSYGMFYYFFIAIIGAVLLVNEISQNSNYADAVENSNGWHRLFMLVSMISIMLFNKWLW